MTSPRSASQRLIVDEYGWKGTAARARLGRAGRSCRAWNHTKVSYTELATARSQCTKGIKFSHAPHKVYEGVQIHKCCEVHAHEVHAHEVYAHEVHAHKTHAYEIGALEMHAQNVLR